MEKLVIEINKNLFSYLVEDWNESHPLAKCEANIDYTIKEVKIEDDLFKDDPTHATLKSEANKAYKRLKEYEFKTRNK